MLDKYLEDLERRISPEVEDDLERQWYDFWNNKNQDELFNPKRKEAFESSLEWPEININDAINDDTFELMMLKELCGYNSMLNSAGGYVGAIRTNYGTAIMPSLFGTEVYLMDAEYNTLPGSHPLPGGIDAIAGLIDAGIPDLDRGQGAQVMACAEYYLEKLDSYPKLKRYCHIYHPDLQSSFDICEVIRGSELFLDLYDQPDVIKNFLDLITDTYEAYIDRWFELVKPSEEFNVHYGWIHRGKIRLSLDSCMNLSPEMYIEFAKPYDARLLGKYGGIAHSCGKVDHFVPCMSDIQGYYGFNLSQPEYNDMETVYKSTVDKGIKIMALNLNTANAAIASGRKMHGNLLAI